MEQVTITREWHKPEILTKVSDKEISLALNLADYLLALCEEFGSPTFVLTKATLLAKVQEASDKVVAKVKLESAKVI